MSEAFEVVYHYYQFNSGAADNGNKSVRVEFRTEEDAFDLVRRIEAAVSGKLDEEDLLDLKGDYIAWDGYFLSAKAFRLERTPLDVPPLAPSGRP